MEILRPRISRISLSLMGTISFPSRIICPETMRAAGLGIRRNKERAVMVLPQPDSPTIPRVSPSRKVKLTPSTALVTPQRLKK